MPDLAITSSRENSHQIRSILPQTQHRHKPIPPKRSAQLFATDCCFAPVHTTVRYNTVYKCTVQHNSVQLVRTVFLFTQQWTRSRNASLCPHFVLYCTAKEIPLDNANDKTKRLTYSKVISYFSRIIELCYQILRYLHYSTCIYFYSAHSDSMHEWFDSYSTSKRAHMNSHPFNWTELNRATVRTYMTQCLSDSSFGFAIHKSFVSHILCSNSEFCFVIPDFCIRAIERSNNII